MSNSSPQKEKLHRTEEKPTFENARKVRGTYETDPKAEEIWMCAQVLRCRENREKTSERTPSQALEDRKEREHSDKHRQGENHSHKPAHEIKSQMRDHEDHTAEREVQFLESFLPCAQAFSFAPSSENSGRKSCSRQSGRSERSCQHGQRRVKSKIVVTVQAHNKGTNSSCCNASGVVPLEQHGLEPKFHNTFFRSCQVARRCCEGPIQDRALCSPSKDLQHLKQRQKFWT